MDRHYLQEELYRRVRESDEIFEFLQSGSLDGIWYWDLENPEVEWLSPRFWETFGYAPQEKQHLVAEWQDLIHPEDLAVARENLEKHIADPDHPYDQIVRYRHKDGSTVWVRCRGLAIRDEAGKPVRLLGAHTNVTPQMRTTEQLNQRVAERTGELRRVNEALEVELAARHQQEEERRALEEQLWEAQRIDSLMLMAGGVAHYFNNLLTVIMGNAEAIEERNASPQIARLVEETIEAADTAADLSRQITLYTGKSAPLNQVVDLSSLVWEARTLVKASVGDRASLELDLSPHLPVDADPAQLSQVFMNLVINAAEASEGAGGRIIVRTGREGANQRRAPTKQWSYFKGDADDAVFLEVSDSGKGMTQETVDRIIDPFFTTKRVGKGLGLAVARGVVESHGATLQVFSERERGTTVRILFPPAATEPRTELAALAADSNVVAMKVLLVDDEPAIRRLVGFVLESAGHETIVASSGAEALRILDDHQRRVEMVLLDLAMPGVRGEEVFRRIVEDRPDTPVLIISGYSQQSAYEMLRSEHNVGFLQKPFTAENLLKAIHALRSPRAQRRAAGSGEHRERTG